MKDMLFISRHAPTTRQVELSAARGFSLIHVGDVDGFDMGAIRALVATHEGATAFAVVNAAVALNLLAILGQTIIGVFENANRAAEGAKPQFEAKALHVWTSWQDASHGVFVSTHVVEHSSEKEDEIASEVFWAAN